MKFESIKNKIWSLKNFGPLKVEPKNFKKCNFYNIFTTISQINLNSKLLPVVIGGQKSDFCGRFKLELVKTTHLRYVIKMLKKYYEHSTSKKLSKQIQFSPKAQIKCLSVCLVPN